MTQTQSNNLRSNLEYIRLFRHPDRLDGQEEYYLTNLESAVEFIQNISAKDLKIDPNDYQRKLNSDNTQSFDLLEMNPPNPLEVENLALKSALNTFIEKIYKLKTVSFEDQTVKDLKVVNTAAFDLLEQVT